MDIKQNAKLSIQKGDNVHEYHVPPNASIPECYDVVREMLGYLFDRLKADFEAANTAKTPGAPEESAPVEVVTQPQE